MKINYPFLILSILLVVAVGTAIYFYKKSILPAQIIAAQQILKHPETPVTDTFRDKHGNHHAEFGANTNRVPQSALKDSVVKRDSIIQAVDSELSLADASHLMEVTQENLQLRAAVLRLKRDSANIALLAYKDPSISFNYDPRDSTVRDMLINLHLNQVKYGKRKLFSNTPVYDFWADDQRVTFSGFTHFTVAIPPPLFGLTTDAKTSYSFSSGRIVPSIGLNLRIQNFFLEGRNYYSLKKDRFQQLLSFGYKQTIF